jgi:hypothetical protein
VTDTPWQWRIVADPARLEPAPVAMPPAAAQEWCGFTVWEPTALPPDCRLLAGTLRKEAPPGRFEGAVSGRTPWSDNNPASYRYEIGGPERLLRVKQFLYDLAFPALDHPCLWESRTHAVPLDERYVVWFGTDYTQRPGASARLGRTLIELSVLDGSFTDDEITALYRAMRPTSERSAERVNATPFAALSYPARYPATVVSVPVGLWAFRRGRRDDRGTWTGGPDAGRALLKRFGLPDELNGFAVDSAAEFVDGAGHGEIEVLYTAPPDRGHELRLIVQLEGGGRIETPPRTDKHPCTTAVLPVAEVEVFLAYIDERYGPFDAVWRDPVTGVPAKLLSTTGVGLDLSWFVAAVEQVIRSGRELIGAPR